MFTAVILFGILILIHEMGHYLAAKWAGVTVLEFSIGMGPKVFQWGRGETRYSLRMLPVGGYVKMDDEEPDSQAGGEAEQEPLAEGGRTVRFRSIPIWRRAVVLSSGALMNLLSAMLAMVVLVAANGAIASTTVAGYLENNISARYGLQPGDGIERMDGRTIHISNDIIYALMDAGERPITLQVSRQGELVTLPDVRFPVEGGVQVNDFTCTRLPFNPITIVREAFFRCITFTKEIYGAFYGMLTGSVSVSELSGPVGTMQMISESARVSLWQLVYLGIFISINLGVFNLLPFPALDGGRLLFLLIEKLRGKPVRPEVEGLLNLAGFALLMLLVVAVTFKDVATLFGGG